MAVDSNDLHFATMVFMSENAIGPHADIDVPEGYVGIYGRADEKIGDEFEKRVAPLLTNYSIGSMAEFNITSNGEIMSLTVKCETEPGEDLYTHTFIEFSINDVVSPSQNALNKLKNKNQ